MISSSNVFHPLLCPTIPVVAQVSALRKKPFDDQWTPKRLFFRFLKKFIGVVDLQCHVSFKYTAKWFDYTYTYIHSLFYWVFFWLHFTARGILALWWGIEPTSPALQVWSLNYWTTRELPLFLLFMIAMEIIALRKKGFWVIKILGILVLKADMINNRLESYIETGWN